MNLPPGTNIGAYTIQQQIGQGGMGVVYTAFQQNVGRTVVLKVLSAKLDGDPDALGRFQREVAIIAQLEHPHILPVYDFGDIDGNPYIVMRYMRGGTLADVMDELSLPKKLLILGQIAEALEAAHKWQIVHRDLKPGNILLDEVGNAYLADFGLAKGYSDTSLTATGGIVGTPAYMSPEQARGEPLDASTDIYSLAVMTYQLLAGQHPFPANNPVDYLSKHLIEPPPYISIILPTVPLVVEAILRQGLAKERHERPLKATDLTGPIVGALQNVGELMPAFSTTPLRPTPATAKETAVANQTIIAETMVAPQPPIVAAPAPKRKIRYGWLVGMVALVVLVGAVVRFGGGMDTSLLAFSFTESAPTFHTYRVGKSPRAMLWHDGAMWVTNGFDNSVSQLVATHCTEQNDPCGQAIATYPVTQLPVALTATDSAIWVAGALDGVLMALDPNTGDVLQTVALPHLPTRLQTSAGNIWVLNEFANALTQYNLTTDTLQTLPLADTPHDFLIADGSLWITFKGGTLGQFNPQTGASINSYQLGMPLKKLGWDGQALWLTAPENQQLLRFDVATGAVSQQIALPEVPVALGIAGNSVWITTESQNLYQVSDLLTPIATPNGGFVLRPVPCGDNCYDFWLVGQTDDVVTRWRWQEE